MKRLYGWLALLALAAVVVAGCGGDDSGAAAAGGSGKELRKVKIQLNIYATTYHAGIFVAMDKGYYADEGLEVELQDGTGSTQAAQLVASNEADFGYVSVDGVLRVADAGGHTKMVASVLNDAGFCLMVRSDSGIEEPKDIEGHTVGDAAGFITLQVLPALFDATGVDGNKVEIVNVDPASRLRAWAAGAYDGMSSLFVEPITAKAVEGIDNTCFPFRDYGVNLAGYGLIASPKALEDPDLVERFVRATLHGYQDVYDDPQMGAETLLRLGPESVTSQKGIETSAPLVLEKMASLAEASAAPDAPFGTMPDELWQSHTDVMRKYADLGDDFDAADFYTNEFVEKE